MDDSSCNDICDGPCGDVDIEVDFLCPGNYTIATFVDYTTTGMDNADTTPVDDMSNTNNFVVMGLISFCLIVTFILSA